jgi:hypothetical protein
VLIFPFNLRLVKQLLISRSNMRKDPVKNAKRKMQNVDFKNVNEFLDFLPENELKIVETLRKIVFECIPEASERLSYNVPYYKRKYTVCFIWPSSITWGNVKHRGVRFGFASGHLMADDLNYLDKGKRKNVYWKDFKDVKEIDVELLKAYIYEAVLVDEQKTKRARSKG